MGRGSGPAPRSHGPAAPPSSAPVARLAGAVERELLPGLAIESVDPRDPVIVRRVPAPWEVVGAGNYAAVFAHPGDPDHVVKVYAPGRPGIDAEVEVYRRLGAHPAYSRCEHAGDGWLVLRRLRGVTLYDCVSRGIPIPDRVIRDVDDALDYARRRGLHPHDVHGRNVMMHEGRGLVVDVSDFLERERCSKWRDLKRAYSWIYRPLLRPLRLRVPHAVLDLVRAAYRLFRRALPVSS